MCPRDFACTLEKPSGIGYGVFAVGQLSGVPSSEKNDVHPVNTSNVEVTRKRTFRKADIAGLLRKRT